MNLAPNFRLGGPPIDTEYSSGFQLRTVEPLDPRLMRIVVNSGLQAYLRPVNAWVTKKQQLWPSRDKMNFAVDKVNKKLSCEFYLDNELEETNPIVGFDDGPVAAGWFANQWGSGSYALTISDSTEQVAKGANSMKFVIGAGTKSAMRAQYGFGADQDYSGKDFVSFYWYGANSGNSITIQALDSTGNNYYRSPAQIDNFTGWKRIVIPKATFVVGGGSPSWSAIRYLGISTYVVSIVCTWYFDRMVLDTGQWVNIEIAVPDQLVVGTYNGDWNSKATQPHSANIYCWNGNTYAWGLGFSCDAARSWDNCCSGPTFLGNITGIYQPSYTGLLPFRLNVKKTSTLQTFPTGGTWGNNWITYNGVGGTKCCVGLAIKMPPSDLQQSSTYGISQARLKLDVFYA